MVTINGTQYRLCLLDTNVVSELAKGPDELLGALLAWSLAEEPVFVPCLVPFSVLELRQSPAVYEQFLTRFDRIPSLLLKGHEQLLEDEVAAYPNRSRIDPCLLGFAGHLGREGTRLRTVLDHAFEQEALRRDEERWIDGRQDVVEGMVSLVGNWQPAGNTYSPSEIKHFIEIAGFSQVAMRQPEFAQREISAGRAVDLSAFPSVKAMVYTVFHKFYVDAVRKPSRSDAFDVVIASATPYVDAVITEAHQTESLRKTKRLDSFIDHVRVITLRDLRSRAPTTGTASARSAA